MDLPNVLDIQNIFLQYSNEEKSKQMTKYLKGKFDFFGIPSPIRRQISKEIISRLKSAPLEDILALVEELWTADQRELQYLAMDIVDRKKRFLNFEHLNLGEHLILSKSWWDTVDYLSTHFFAPILIKLTKKQRLEYVIKLVEHPSLWMNRVGIIFQLMRKEDTETEILELAIVPHIDSKEFFHQKAIGWALRQYSKTNPLWVSEFIDFHPLASLSKREASKYL